MSKLKPLTYEMLKSQHLSVVREIGRFIGVKASTAKKKDALIEEIIAIQTGKHEPDFSDSNRGAPIKFNIDISDFMEPEEQNKGKFISSDTSKPQKITRPDAKKRGVQLKTSAEKSEENYQFNKTESVAPQEQVSEVGDGFVEIADNAVDTKRRYAIRLRNEVYEVEGVLEQHVQGYGFLRVNNYENSRDDAYVSLQNIKKYNLRRGDKVKARVKKSGKEGDSAALQEVISINDLDPALFLERNNFDDLVPYYPTERIKLETEGTGDDIAIRCIDLFSPIGFGQRGLIVAPPKTGKTTLLKKIAQSIENNYENVKLIVLLIDERPEEVTDIKRSVSGEVVFSTFDEHMNHHIRAAELVVNRAKRLVEVGQNVVILMDSITRLARAYNNTIESSGKTLSGGLDPMAVQGPKRFFGAARNIENGGSLTILSTALIDTGSRMDDVIYEEFKGTGNMEIHLSRELSEKRIFPAIDLYKSGTRKDELLLNKSEQAAVYKLRKFLSERGDATDTLIGMMEKSKNNEDLMKKLDVWLNLYRK